MSVGPVNVPRISQALRTQTLLEQVRHNQLRLFRQQQRIATGQNLLAASDEPVTAGKIIRLTDRFARQDQILANLKHADRWLSASEAAVTSISDLLTQAKTIASEQVNSFQSTEQRVSAAILVDGILDQLLSVGNQQFDGRYLFGGHRSTAAPLDSALGRVTFVGDTQDRNALVDDDLQRPFNLTADRLFGLADGLLRGIVDLNPALSATTRLTDLGGALGAGIRDGIIRATQTGGVGAGSFDLDITGIDTMGQLIDRFNGAAAAAGVSLTASLTASGLQIAGAAGSQVRIDAVNNTPAAGDIGILGTGGVGVPLVGADVNPKLTLTTPLSALSGGAGLSLPSGVQVNNGNKSATVTFAGATTVQDVLNRLNSAGVGIRAEINVAGDGIDVQNQVAGSDLFIGENGGTDAAALGIRTLHGATTLADLNGGRGVRTLAGPDLQIIDANNIAFDVDLDGALTLQDVIDRINTAAAGAGSSLTASLKPTGNGLRLAQPAGSQNIVVQRGGLSGAADDLGLLKTGTTSTLDGDDVNPIRQSGVFSVLYRLADALRADNTREITAAGEQLEAVIRAVNDQRGRLGSRSQAVSERVDRTEDAVLATRRFLSELKDADLTEAVTKFQQAQLALQANLQVGATLLNGSLLDFLR